jgi:iron complex transport system permease protein
MSNQENGNQQNQRHTRFRVLLFTLGGILVLSVILGVSLGPVSIPIDTVWSVIAYKLGFTPAGDWSTGVENIVWLIRLPRVLLAVVVGGGLAIVGVTLQALVRNPLADPYVLGISSGASVGAVLAIGFGVLAFYGTLAISFAAFLGAVLAFLIVYTLANLGKRITPESLILAGIGVGYIFTGITSFITLTSNKRQLAGQVLAWTLGSLARASWFDLSLPTLTLLAITIYLVLQARNLNALIVGDETASVLGVNVDIFRRRVFTLVALITGVMVAVSGSIGFIGLMIPHMVRFVVGSDHRKVLPLSLFVGSIFLIWADVLARGFHSTIDNPIELPVGVVTSILGGPFFIWLMLKTRLKRRVENL